MFHIRKGNRIEIQSNGNEREPRVWIRAWIDSINYVQLSICVDDFNEALAKFDEKKEAV